MLSWPLTSLVVEKDCMGEIELQISDRPKSRDKEETYLANSSCRDKWQSRESVGFARMVVVSCRKDQPQCLAILFSLVKSPIQSRSRWAVKPDSGSSQMNQACRSLLATVENTRKSGQPH